MTFSKLEEELLGLLEAILDRLDGLTGEILVLDNELVKVVSQEIGADVTAMAIIDSKEGALGPLAPTELLRLRLHNIQDYSDSIFVVITDDALVSISSIGCDDSVALGRVLSGLIIRHELFDLLIGAVADLASYHLIEIFA